MPTGSGARLGPYVLGPALGAGGMGEVYRAHDSRLGRDVAIKILPPDVVDDPERLRRFESEARAAAALNHPNILVVHDVGREHDTAYLVTELLEGRTLRAVIDGGAVPHPRALDYAVQIAEGLATAHARGIVHRDLKPENLFVTTDGRVKILDFGLAKAVTLGEAAVAATVTTPLAHGTAPHVVLGTPGYMAPEQVRGGVVDHRADIFAFGCVLYELLTDRNAFEGDSQAAILAAILERDPAPPSSLQPSLPSPVHPLMAPLLDRIVRQCLAKAPGDRPDSAHDVANELRWIREMSDASPAAVREGRRSVRAGLLIAGGLAAAAAGAGVMSWVRPGVPTALVTHVSLDVRPAEELNAGDAPSIERLGGGGSRTALAWTPDGRALVFVGRRGGIQQLYVRPLDGDEARPLKGTEWAQAPAVSPDGQWVAFWADRAIRRVPISGGPVVELASVDNPPSGLVWGQEGLFFDNPSDSDRRIWWLGGGGAAKPITTLGEGELRHVLPSPLPDGRHLLYTARRRTWTWGDEEIVVQSLVTGERQTVLTDGSDARYVSSGHLVFLRRGQLFGVPFDPKRLEISGAEMPVLDGSVSHRLAAGNWLNVTGAGQFAIASTGTLAWIPGALLAYPDRELVRIDLEGNVTPLGAPHRSYGVYVRVAPDGRRLAVNIAALDEVGVWLYDLGRGQLAPLQRSGEAWGPLWTPDGQRVVFRWLEDGQDVLVVQTANSPEKARVVAAGGTLVSPSSFTPDGRTLIALRGEDIVTVTVDGRAGSTVETLMETPQLERWPELSPDGRWLAYGSNESGRFEVYVRPYPALDAVEQVSISGGGSPAWHPAGSELFFLSLDDSEGKRWMMASRLQSASPLRFGHPRPLFSFNPRELPLSCTPYRCFDVDRSGSSFYTSRTVPMPPPLPVTHVNIVQNWVQQLKARVPSR
jgi:eukaryotic-like serine/threonine-protein kinase